MRITEIFLGRGPLRDTADSLVVCGLVGAVILAGYAVGRLGLAVNLVIGSFAVLQGLVPIVRTMASLHVDRRRNYTAVLDLQSVSGDLFDAVAEQDMTDAGSIYQCLGTIKALEGRTSPDEAVKRSLKVAKLGWQKMLQPAISAAQSCPSLGLGGSIVGLCGLLAAGSDDEAIKVALMTTFSSTGLGCAASFVLTRLVAVGGNWIDEHVAQVEFVVSALLGGKSGESGEPLDDTLL